MRATEPRLGRIESSIVHVLERRGGVCAREGLIDALFPGARDTVNRGRMPVGRPRDARQPQPRATVESTLSRALASLERKGLVIRERSRVSGRTLLRSATAERLPAWEHRARAEEDLAARMAHLARTARRAAAEARRRATLLRSSDHGSAPTEGHPVRDATAHVVLGRHSPAGVAMVARSREQDTADECADVDPWLEFVMPTAEMRTLTAMLRRTEGRNGARPA